MDLVSSEIEEVPTFKKFVQRHWTGVQCWTETFNLLCQIYILEMARGAEVGFYLADLMHRLRLSLRLTVHALTTYASDDPTYIVGLRLTVLVRTSTVECWLFNKRGT